MSRCHTKAFASRNMLMEVDAQGSIFYRTPAEQRVISKTATAASARSRRPAKPANTKGAARETAVCAQQAKTKASNDSKPCMRGHLVLLVKDKPLRIKTASKYDARDDGVPSTTCAGVGKLQAEEGALYGETAASRKKPLQQVWEEGAPTPIRTPNNTEGGFVLGGQRAAAVRKQAKEGVRIVRTCTREGLAAEEQLAQQQVRLSAAPAGAAAGNGGVAQTQPADCADGQLDLLPGEVRVEVEGQGEGEGVAEDAREAGADEPLLYQLARLKDQLAEREKQLAASKAQAQMLSVLATQTAANYQQLVADNGQLTANYEQLSAACTQLMVKHAGLAAAYSELTADKAALVAANSQLMADKAALAAANSQLTADKAALAAANSELTADMAGLVARVLSLQQEARQQRLESTLEAGQLRLRAQRSEAAAHKAWEAMALRAAAKPAPAPASVASTPQPQNLACGSASWTPGSRAPWAPRCAAAAVGSARGDAATACGLTAAAGNGACVPAGRLMLGTWFEEEVRLREEQATEVAVGGQQPGSKNGGQAASSGPAHEQPWWAGADGIVQVQLVHAAAGCVAKAAACTRPGVAGGQPWSWAGPPAAVAGRTAMGQEGTFAAPSRVQGPSGLRRFLAAQR